MAFNRSIFIVRAARRDAESILLARAALIERYFQDLAPAAVSSTAWIEPLRAFVGVVDFDGAAHDFDETLVWGTKLTTGLDSPRSFIEASDSDLRSERGTFAAIAVTGACVRVATGAAGLTTLYHARKGELEAWSSHAAPAAMLVAGEAHLDESAVPELLALEFLGGTRTLVSGSEAVPVATTIDILPGEATTRTYWPLRDRWLPVPESEAPRAAERALLEHLGSRLDGHGRIELGLTAGSDSRVVAAAMRELGLSARAFTWGEPNWPDVRGAVEVADVLELPHRVEPIAWHRPGETLPYLRRWARWHEGTVPTGVSAQVWPEGAPAIVTGAGGEVGRAFYYRFSLASYPRPSLPALRAALPFASRLRLADVSVRNELETRVRDRVEELASLGLEGWRTLDVYYGEERVRQWGRARVPPTGGDFVPAFVWPDVSRAMASLPLCDRATDAFHRRFLASHAPDELVPPSLALQRSGIPPYVRRAAAKGRAWRSRVRPPESGLGLILERNSELRDWLLRDVLERPLLSEQFGRRWVTSTRRGFAGHAALASEQTVLAAAAITFGDVLRGVKATVNGPTGFHRTLG